MLQKIFACYRAKYVKTFLETHDLVEYTKLSEENMMFIMNTIDSNKESNYINILKHKNIVMSNEDIEYAIMIGKYCNLKAVIKNEKLFKFDNEKIFKYACMYVDYDLMCFCLNNKIIPKKEHLYYVLMNRSYENYEKVIELLINFKIYIDDDVYEVLRINNYDFLLSNDKLINVHIEKINKQISLLKNKRESMLIYKNRENYKKYSIQQCLNRHDEFSYDKNPEIFNLVLNNNNGVLEMCYEVYNHVPQKENILKIGNKGRRYVVMKRFYPDKMDILYK